MAVLFIGGALYPFRKTNKRSCPAGARQRMALLLQPFEEERGAGAGVEAEAGRGAFEKRRGRAKFHPLQLAETLVVALGAAVVGGGEEPAVHPLALALNPLAHT